MVKDIDNAQSNPKLVDAAMVRASYNMNDVIDQYLAGLLLAGVATDNVLYSDTTAVTPTSANAYDYLVDLGVKLSECNVPMYGRWVVVPPWMSRPAAEGPALCGQRHRLQPGGAPGRPGG